MDELIKDDERKELIEQLSNDTNRFIKSMRKVIDVNSFDKCDIKLLEKLHNSYEVFCNVLDEIFTNTSTTDI